jgi:uncharacterized protein YfaS (alpha-2-macroglobulin family)
MRLLSLSCAFGLAFGLACGDSDPSAGPPSAAPLSQNRPAPEVIPRAPAPEALPEPAAEPAAAPPATKPANPAEPLPVVPWTGEYKGDWKKFDELENEQKYEEASKLVEAILEAAKSAARSQEWTRALVRRAQLRMALHGYETAVRHLKDSPWPKDLLGHSMLHFYFAQSLTTYNEAYSYEIRQRERVDTKGELDLKKWTQDQIRQAVQEAYEAIWLHREQLGAFKARDFPDYLNPNSYPETVRPTLRDALSYLRISLLADTGSWRPEHTAGVYRLGVGKLLAPSAPENLTDPEVHPLARLATVAADLEAWHAGRDEKEAALEAHLELVRRLYAGSTDADDRERLRSHLEAHLPAYEALSWWAMGIHDLATMKQDEAVSDALVQAREIAIRGRDKYPGTPGGERCGALVESIEQPHFHMEAMSDDATNKRSIRLEHRNLAALYFRAYPLDVVASIEKSNDYNLFPNDQELEALIAKSKPIAAWKTDLPPTPEYRVHTTYVVPPMAKTGHYTILASAREDFGAHDNVLHGVHMGLGDLALVTQTPPGELLVHVLSGSQGSPIEGAKVHLYEYDWRSKHRRVATAVSGKDGAARFDRHGQQYFVLAEHRGEWALDPDYRYASQPREPHDTHNTFLYTDRSIYRPQQKIFWKAVLYFGRERSWRTQPASLITIYLRDANREEVAQTTVTTNQYGTASGEFVVPAGRVLGQWFLASGHGGQTPVRVEEYKRPTFEVEVPKPGNALRLNQEVSITGKAGYYFGLPVTGGKVVWRVTRAPRYPWWWWWYYGHGWGWSPPAPVTQTIASGTATMKEDGTFEVKFVPEAKAPKTEQEKGMSYTFSLSADVTDEGGETRSASLSFQLGHLAVMARVSHDAGFFRAGQGGELVVHRTTLDGVGLEGAGDWRLVSIKKEGAVAMPADEPLPEPPPESGGKTPDATPGDRLRPRWEESASAEQTLFAWKDGEEFAAGKLAHDKDGKAPVALPKLEAGAYRLHYTTTDPFGAVFKTHHEFVVAGQQVPVALPAFFRVEQSSVPVGGTARVLAHSGFDGQPMFFDVYRDQTRVSRQILKAGSDPALIEIPVKEEDRGGFGMTLWVMRDHQFLSLSSSVYVPWDTKELELEFGTFRDTLRPGHKETWTVKVKAPSGVDASAKALEVLAYMYDRSLDIFAPHNPPQPLSLYPRTTGTPGFDTNLGQAPSRWLPHDGFRAVRYVAPLQVDRLQVYRGYGIGGPGGRFGHPEVSVASPAPMKRSEPGSPPMPEQKLQEALETKAEVTAGAVDGRGRVTDGEQPAAPVQLRTNFSETAFWKPHLVPGPDGTVSLEFEVPDSVTSWNVWVHAVTKGLESGSLKVEAKTVKELMVRPYLPRFLREADRATLKVVVNNASDAPLSGTLDFDILDPATDTSVAAKFGLTEKQTRGVPFKVEPRGGTNLSFDVVTPSEVGLVAFRVTARAGQHSDGELRPIPLLPGRMHLMQSRFVTLKEQGKRELVFEDLAANDDPTRLNEQLVVTLDAQLFYSLLAALPYLVNYPYECTEQTLNRFLATGILSSMYQQYPSIASMAKQLSERPSALERWDDDDPNRKLALEETPWLQQSRGKVEGEDHGLLKVLDPKLADATRRRSLTLLRKAQTSSGAFPWFPGGWPDPYITLYLLHGFSKAIEFGVEVPRDMVVRAWRYMHRHYIEEFVRHAMALDCCWEMVTLLNYVLSNYPDTSWTGNVFTAAERTRMLDFSLGHWKEHAPYLKGYLTLTLWRMDRKDDARKVWASVMDSAKTERDLGTFWAPEDRAWLWYQDTIETHAFALRTLLEVEPEDKQLEGLVQWLFLNKKLNHWKSTKATAEVLYSVATYLKRQAAPVMREETLVTVGEVSKSFVFEPDTYTGKKNQLVILGPQIDPQKSSHIVIDKGTPGMQFASATWHFSTERLPEEARGDFLQVTRTFYKRAKRAKEIVLEPLAEGAPVAVGDEIEVQISLRSKHQLEYVHLRDPRAAGTEPVTQVSKHKYDLGIRWYEEIRDSGTNFFFDQLPVGEYTFKYRIRAATAGVFKVAPATLQPMYAPEFAAYSAGNTLTIRAE